MTMPRVHPFTMLAILLMACLAGPGSKASAADPILRFPDDITWKGVFDIGFRPKHVSGLERRTCESREQAFQFQLGNVPEMLVLDRGTLTFELKADNGIRMIWHQGRVPISLDEGERRLEQFRQIMKGHVTQKGQMPVILDEATATVHTERHFDAGAIIGSYSFIYGFDSSFTKGTPLIPHFYIVSRESMEESLPIRKEIVAPPEGYDWYSLDPKIDTPAPGIRRAVKEPVPPQPGPVRQLLSDAGFFEHPFRTLGLLAVVVGGMVILIIIVLLRLILAGRS